MFWFFLHLAGAFCWVTFAVGWLPYEPWVVTVAFCLLAVNSVLGAMKSLLEI